MAKPPPIRPAETISPPLSRRAPETRPGDTPPTLEDGPICSIPRARLKHLMPATQWREDYPLNMAVRIDYLLKQGHAQCSQGENSYPNCFGTTLWVIGADPNSRPTIFGPRKPDGHWDACDQAKTVDAGVNLLALLGFVGYRHVATREVIEGNEYLDPIPIMTDAGETGHRYPIGPGHVRVEALSGLKSGDVLIFGSVLDDPTAPSHSALVVGHTAKGEPLIFHKPSQDCGPRSPFEVVKLSDHLKKFVGTARENDYAMNYMHVFHRRTSPPLVM